MISVDYSSNEENVAPAAPAGAALGVRKTALKKKYPARTPWTEAQIEAFTIAYEIVSPFKGGASAIKALGFPALGGKVREKVKDKLWQIKDIIGGKRTKDKSVIARLARLTAAMKVNEAAKKPEARNYNRLAPATITSIVGQIAAVLDSEVTPKLVRGEGGTIPISGMPTTDGVAALMQTTYHDWSAAWKTMAKEAARTAVVLAVAHDRNDAQRKGTRRLLAVASEATATRARILALPKWLAPADDAA